MGVEGLGSGGGSLGCRVEAEVSEGVSPRLEPGALPWGLLALTSVLLPLLLVTLRLVSISPETLNALRL